MNVKNNYYITSKPDYKLDKNQKVKIHNEHNNFEKRRTLINKNEYKVKNRNGNIYELINTNTNEKIYKPRYEIIK